MPSPRSQRRFAVAALVLGLVVAVGLLESIPRLLPGLMPAKVRDVQRIYSARGSWENMMQADRELGFALKPGLDLQFPSEAGSIGVRTTSLGIGDLGHRDLGTTAPFDAVAVGDSFTFCDDSTVENCWVRRLADATGLSIADLGVNGYSTMAEARLLARAAPVLKPRLVLAGFFPNDFKDNVHFDNWTRSGTDDYWTWMRRKRRSDVSEWLAAHSFVYRIVDAARRYGDRKTVQYRSGGVELLLRDDDWWWGVVQRNEVTPTYRLTEESLLAMNAAAQASGARLVVLLFPFKEQVYWDQVRGFLAKGGEMEAGEIDAPLRAMAEHLNAHSIDVCDLTPALRREAAAGKQLYLKNSAHWTAEGNRVAAEEIRTCLGGKGFLKNQP